MSVAQVQDISFYELVHKLLTRDTEVEADFDHAVRRHRMLDAIRRASETGQRQKVQ